MKRIFYVIACAFIVSCSTEKKQETLETENEMVNYSPDTTVNLHPEMDNTTSDEIEVEQTESVSNSNDLDEAIVEYEKYMDDYIKFIKKGKAGDHTAMLDAMELMTKAQSVSEKLDAAKGELTVKQLKTFTRIQTKLLEAAQ